MIGGPAQILLRRISELDDDQHPDEPDRDLRHFVWVMQSCIDGSMGPTGSAVITPAESDELVDSCQLLARISMDDRPLVDGPLRQGRQHWIATGRHASLGAEVPTPARFVDAGRAPDGQRSQPNPTGFGLYTSTPARRGDSMWRIYLDLFPSEMTPWPWYVWQLESRRQPIVEISSATDWTRFVEAYGRKTEGLVFPDWG